MLSQISFVRAQFWTKRDTIRSNIIKLSELSVLNPRGRGGTFNVEVIGMLVGNFFGNPKNTQILILNP